MNRNSMMRTAQRRRKMRVPTPSILYLSAARRPLPSGTGMYGRLALTTLLLYVVNIEVRKTFKYRLYPNKPQQRLLEQQLEECRWLYNEWLAARRDAWE